jgi:flagellar protein FliO/FliZ
MQGGQMISRPSIFRRAASSAVAIVLLAPAAALAAPAATATPDKGEQTLLNFSDDKAASTAHASSGGGMVRTIVGLAIVIGVIYGLTWVLRQVKGSKATSAQGHGLENVATLPLAQNKSLHLVRAGDELVLVGAGDHGVTPIRTYSAQEALALGLVPDEDADADAAPAPRAAKTVGGLLELLRKRTVVK